MSQSSIHFNRRSLIAAVPGLLVAAAPRSFPIRRDYLKEHESIPAFWQSSVEDVARFLKQRVKKGRVTAIGTTAGRRPMNAVFYGQPRKGTGTSTFSGSLGLRRCAGVDRPRLRAKGVLRDGGGTRR